MSLRRSIIYIGLTFSLASLAFSFGSWLTQRQMIQQLAASDARLATLRDEMARNILEMRGGIAFTSGTKGQGAADVVGAAGSSRSAHSAIVDEVKRQRGRERSHATFRRSL